ncbi:MAG TPA: hypothetical protein VHE30_16070 [Polyangiaceae bacterium]|nr:hypothetical protein [Polyangiaceae bacterium]
MKPLRAVWLVGLSGLAVVAACGSPLQDAGTSCSADDACSAGLSCLPLMAKSGDTCTLVASVCSKGCRVDSDCAAVGPNFKCFLSCDGSGTCGRTE